VSSLLERLSGTLISDGNLGISWWENQPRGGRIGRASRNERLSTHFSQSHQTGLEGNLARMPHWRGCEWSVDLLAAEWRYAIARGVSPRCSTQVRMEFRPGGTFDNSPAVYCWVDGQFSRHSSPGGTIEAISRTIISIVPTGLCETYVNWRPSDESLGYCQLPLRGNTRRLVFINEGSRPRLLYFAAPRLVDRQTASLVGRPGKDFLPIRLQFLQMFLIMIDVARRAGLSVVPMNAPALAV
jgi:hypothetical protein